MKNSQDSFSRFLLLSLGFHVAIFVILTVKFMLFPGDPMEFQQAVRVDVVALPEKIKEPPAPPAAEEPEQVKEEVVKKDPPKPPKKKKPELVEKPKKPKKPKKVVKKEPDLKKVKEDQDSALAKIKKEMAERKKRLEQEQQKVEYKGNNLSKGNSLTGLEQIKYDAYSDELLNHIRSFWNLPEWLAEGNFNASVVLVINNRGGIISKSFIRKSGNELFDQYVVSTLDKALPLPAPPAELTSKLSTTGMEIRFPQ